MKSVILKPKTINTNLKVTSHLSAGVYMVVEIGCLFYIAKQLNYIHTEVRPFTKKNGKLSTRKKKFTEIRTHWTTTNPTTMFSSLFEVPYGYVTRQMALDVLRKHEGVLIIENEGLRIDESTH